MRYSDAEAIDPRVINLLHEVKDTITASQCTKSYTTGTVFTGIQGRPKFNIPKEQLQFLVEQRFSIPAIADILGVSQYLMSDEFVIPIDMPECQWACNLVASSVDTNFVTLEPVTTFPRD